jgi:hypothetical protein
MVVSINSYLDLGNVATRASQLPFEVDCKDLRGIGLEPRV